MQSARTGWNTSWSQDCRDKYKQPHICRWYYTNGRKWRGSKEFLDEGEKGEWKTGLKLKIQKTKMIFQSHDFITNRRAKVETVIDFLLGSKITVDGDCSHETRRWLLTGRKAMTNLESILKSRDITWPTKVRIVKAMVFPVVMFGCERWTIKKSEHQRNCCTGEDSSEPLGLQGDPTSQS